MAEKTVNPWRTRGKWLLALVLFVLLLPELLRLALTQTVSALGIGELSLGDIDLDLFAATLVVKDLSFAQDGVEKLTVDFAAANISWLRSTTEDVHVEGLQLAGVRLSVLQNAQGQWDVVIPLFDQTSTNGGDDESADEEELASHLFIDGVDIQDVSITVSTQDVQGVLLIDQLNLQRFSTRQAHPPVLHVSAAWNKTPLLIDLAGQSQQDHQTLSGHVRISQFKLDDWAALIGRPVTGSLNLTLSVSAELDPQRNVKGLIEGSISLDKVALKYNAIDISSRELLWRGDLAFEKHEEAISYNVGGDFYAADLLVEDKADNISVLSLKKFSLNNLLVDEMLQLSLESLTVSNVDAMRLAGKTRGAFYNDRVEIQKLALVDANKLIIESLTIRDAQYRATITPEGSLQIESALSAVTSAVAEEKKTDNNKSAAESSSEPVQAFSIAVDRFLLEGDSGIFFVDERFAKPFQHQFSISKFAIEGLDSGQPENEFSLSLLGSLGEFSRIDVSGRIKPFSEQLQLSLTGDLEAIELLDISPYSEAYLGYQLTRGHFDHQFQVEIAQQQLTANNKVHLRQLQLEVVDPDKPQPMERQLDIPLDLALNLLRDSDDNIELDVPIEGDLDQPDVDVSDVIGDALGNALMSGTTNYLKFVLQPYGAVLMAADFVGDQMSTIRLDPIIFIAGESSLSEQQRNYIDKVAGLMTERPNLSLNICATANEADHIPVAESEPDSKAQVPIDELIDIARKRGKNVKRRFISQSIQSRRLLLCQAKYQPKADGAVSLTM